MKPYRITEQKTVRAREWYGIAWTERLSRPKFDALQREIHDAIPEASWSVALRLWFVPVARFPEFESVVDGFLVPVEELEDAFDVVEE